MGDLADNKPASFPSLPPGCRFYPSEEQLLCYYLTHKTNDDRRFGFDVIKDVDLYGCDPFNLPEASCFRFGRRGRRRHWYCYVAEAAGGARVLRRAVGGYWRRKGRVRNVVGGSVEKVVVGTRKSFVFYSGNSPKTAVRTNWVMYEYSLIGNHQVSFVLCRVFLKCSCRCKGSDHILSSCGEEFGLASPRYDQIIAGNDAVAGVEPREPVIASGTAVGRGDLLFLGDLTARQLISILEEDYMELDDLRCPLSSINFT